MTVPEVAPSWPRATITSVEFASRAASAFTAGRSGRTSNVPRLPGKTTSGVDTVVNPTKPSFMPPPISKTFDFDHSGGVCPLGKTTLEEIIGNGASGINSERR